jgi:hypothetical protein
MILDPVMLAVGIALLWFPRQWMRRGLALLRRRRRSSGSERIVNPWKDREPGDPQVQFWVEFRKFRNYIDLLRGAAGSLAIWGGMGIVPGIALEVDAARGVSHQVLGLRCAIFLIGLLIQATRFEKDRLSFYPPIFFLAGLSVGACGYRAAAFAFVMIWAVNPGLSNAGAFLSVYAALLVAFGGLFTSFTSIPVMLMGLLAFLPVVLSLMVKRPLMIFTRKGSRTR